LGSLGGGGRRWGVSCDRGPGQFAGRGRAVPAEESAPGARGRRPTGQRTDRRARQRSIRDPSEGHGGLAGVGAVGGAAAAPGGRGGGLGGGTEGAGETAGAAS